jgi:DNA-binding transcriptional ArsR family regulator
VTTAADSRADAFNVETLEQLKLVSEPLRQRLIAIFARPHTVKAVSERLKEPLTRLYHHIEQLERGGLLKVVSERRVRGAVERTLQATTRRIVVSPMLLENLEARKQLQRTRASLAAAALEDLVKSAGDTAPPMRMIRVNARLSPAALERLEPRLRALLDEMADAEAGEVELMLIAAPRAEGQKAGPERAPAAAPAAGREFRAGARLRS